ncbi:OmpA family protein [Zoogloea sp.]|uniref:OmpA family protein n=1 Tax=Zoogloea sp. TaxID=49181 RepID=UPI0035B08C92
MDLKRLACAGLASVFGLSCLGLSGCANLADSKAGSTAAGAGAGAALGAVISSATGGHHRGRDAALGAAIGALGGYMWSSHMQKQKAEMEAATAGTGIAVTQTADNQLKIEVPSDVSFDSGHAEIKSNLAPILTRFAETLKANPATTVRVVGHTDSTGSDAINNPLSVNRAASVRTYLSHHGVESSRISIDGRGSQEPIADNASESGRARNRRVEIFVAESAAPPAPAGGAPARPADRL